MAFEYYFAGQLHEESGAFTLLIYNFQREFQQNCATVVGLG
jgi:hypothetical protein